MTCGYKQHREPLGISRWAGAGKGPLPGSYQLYGLSLVAQEHGWIGQESHIFSIGQASYQQETEEKQRAAKSSHPIAGNQQDTCTCLNALLQESQQDCGGGSSDMG